jgi:phage FluMu protein Com
MDVTRCPQCRKLLVPVRSANGRTELLCLKCDDVDPLTTDAVTKWAKSPLADPEAA